MLRLGVLAFASGTGDDTQRTEADKSNLAALAFGDQRDGIHLVFEAPGDGDGRRERADADSGAARSEGDFTLRDVDHRADEVVVGIVLVLLHAVVEGDFESTTIDGASGLAEVHNGSVAEGVDVIEIDDLGCAFHLVALRNLLRDSVAAAHGLGLGREEGTELSFAEVTADGSERSEESTLGLLCGGVRVGDLESLGTHHVFVVDFATSHVAGAAFDTTHPGGLNFHGLKVLS